MKEDNVVKIFNTQDNIQAELILGALENNKIPAYKQDMDIGGFMNIYAGNSFSGEEIFVSCKDEEKALEILKDMGLFEE